ncbi:ATP-binding protein [Streptomyces sp. IB2014 016-6]|uniref:sensor histidine kinase n=1 Tax=Streptomyces sp. IB2014 016-6 TaxID=2517818 RepID=UPI0011CA18FA|nr:ATP-binding protein [Streptomyces sp. IB2014 016-6]TXL87498.1 ATP-binding protein [Streptomyces sp. IB2014 016-6]
MSQLRAPAARPDRREGGRHGRPGTRTPSAKASPARGPAAPEPPAPAPPETGIRPQLLCAAVVPTVIATLGGLLAVLVTVRSGGMAPTPEIWAAVVGTVLTGVLAATAAAVGADRIARSVHDRSHALRRSSARAQADLRAVVEQLRRGEGPPPRRPPPAKQPVGDELDLLAHELERSQEHAVAAVVQASRLSSSVGNEQKVEVFVNLARRLQSLVHREIQLLDELENKVEDPDLLKGLFQVDHLATRIRRHAENLAVLGGAISRRQWSRPVTLTEVLRSAVAEVEQYPRVKLVPPVNGTLRGHAVADVVHLLAELVENATLFSAPHTQVLLRAQQVTAGLAIEVEDRGLGMPADEQKRMNALLADPDQVNVAHLLQDGRIGLFVVSALARRHGIAVRLHANIYGGIQAVLVLPQALLGVDGDGSGQSGGQAPGAPMAGSPPAPPPVNANGHAPPPTPAPAPVREPAPAPAPPSVPAQVYEARPGAISPASPAKETRQRPSHRRTSGRRPLPVRGERTARATPAETPTGPTARPRPPEPDQHPRREESFLPEGSILPPPGPEFLPVTDGPSVPGAVRGTMDRPQLPRRRSQEHLVPQLRDAPAPPGDDEQALHDPGLMAAFQRGIGLAEAQPARDHVPGPATELPDPRRAVRDNPPKE